MVIFRLAWRSLWRNRRRTIITVSSIALGITLALFLISMAEGMYKKLIDDAVRMNAGYVTVENREYARAPSVDLVVPSVSAIESLAMNIPAVESVKVLIIGQAMISTGSGSIGVGLIGVDPALERALSPLARTITQGRYIKEDDERGVMIGSGIAERLELEPGMKLVVTCNDSTGELINEMLRVTGIFSTGMEEADGYLIQVPLGVARRIFSIGPDEATQVGMVLSSPDRQNEVIALLRKDLAGGNLAVLPWQEVMPDLAGFMAVDKGSNYVFQGIIIFLLSFTILNTILMSVLERNREFATLLALGTSPVLLRCQVLIETMYIGLLGCGIGLGIGGSISWYFHTYGLDLGSLFGDNLTITGFAVDPVIYNYIGVDLFAWLGGLVFLLTMLIGLYPAFKSTRICLVDVLRSR